MDTVDIVGLLIPVTYFLLLITEKLWPARVFPPRKSWQWIGIAFLILLGTISTVLPLLIPAPWLESHRWLDGTRLGVVGGTIVGFVLMEGMIYAWHRTEHNIGFLWRGFHQIHHSPRRVDIPGAVLFHPLEMIVQVLLQLLVTVIVLGLEPLAAAIIGYLLAFYGFFQHWNVRTPQWLGYLIQRPESHCVHHRMGVHYYNYSDFPPWDMLFGTFRNPAKFMGECGFEAGADRKLGAMLAFADVNAPLYGPGNLGAKAAVTGSSA
jgi:sterol desaturase/sphingolipid hydroxylase (fatty acid hydroxylase superfamily)